MAAVWIGVVVLLTLALGAQARGRILKKERAVVAATRPEQAAAIAARQVNDFERWRVMAPEFLAHRADYVDDLLPNPPVILLIFAPFVRFSPANAQLAWALFKAPLIVGIGWALWRMMRDAGIRMSPWAWGLAAWAWFWPVVGDVQQGQTNLVMLLPLAVGLWLAEHAEADKPLRETGGGRIAMGAAAGAMVALAVAIKVTPAVFLVYFMLRRRWTVIAGAAAGLVLWFLIVPGVAFGFGQNWIWLRHWWGVMIEPYVARGEVLYAVGQSVASLLTRLLRHVPAFEAEGGRAVYVNLVDWPASAVAWIIRGVLLGIGGAGIWWLRPWRRPATLATGAYVCEVGAVAAFMLWASERTWVPHYVSAALTLAGAAVVAQQGKGVWRRAAWGGLALAAVAFMFTSDLSKAAGPDGGEWFKTFGITLIPSMVLAGAIVGGAGTTTDEPQNGK